MNSYVVNFLLLENSTLVSPRTSDVCQSFNGGFGKIRHISTKNCKPTKLPSLPCFFFFEQTHLYPAEYDSQVFLIVVVQIDSVAATMV
jgi:hypothetical protein